MTILRSNRYSLNVPTLVEDPTPGSNTLYIQNEAYDELSLSQNFSKTISYNVAGTGYSTFGTSLFVQNTDPDYVTGVLILSGEVTHVKNLSLNVLNTWKNNLDISPFASMDLNNRIKGARYDTFGSGNSTLLWHEHRGSAAAGAYTTVYHKGTRPPGNDLSTGSPDQNGVLTNSQTMKPVWFNTYTGNLVCVGTYDVSGNCPGGYAGAAFTSSNLTSVGIVSPSIIIQNAGPFATVTCQFVGVSRLTNRAIMMHNNYLTDKDQFFYRYDDGGPSYYTLASIQAIIPSTTSTGGTNWGGDRTTNWGGYMAKFASSTFTDLSSATTLGFFVPYLDIMGNYHPHYIRWNTSNDTFTRWSTTSTTYPAGTTQNNYWSPDWASAGTTAAVNYGMQRVWYNESFLYNTNRYLTFMPLHGAGGVFDNSSTWRTFVTYSVAPISNPVIAHQSLVYHSSLVVPQTPKNIVWLSDDHLTLGVFTYGAFYIYAFNDVSGWTQKSSYPYTFTAVGRDSLNRIWAYDAGPLNSGRLHLLQGNSTPASISIVPSTSTFNYSGSNIPVQLSVDSFDANGNRQANNITLTAVGTSLVLLSTGDQQQVATLTTLTNTSTSVVVQALVTGPGTTGLSANVLI